MPAVFYCHWAGLEHGNELGKEDKALIKSFYPYCCMNHYFGLPTIKITGPGNTIIESPPLELKSYQKPWIRTISRFKFSSLKKCRGAGASEIITVRWKLYRSLVNHIHNRKFVTIAGTSQSLAVEFNIRIKELTDRHPWVYREKPKSDAPDELLIGASRIVAGSTNTQFVRGLENVEDVDLEEPASWDLIPPKDEQVLHAAEPLATKSGASIRVNGTIKGRRGFFWSKIWDPDVDTKYEKMETYVDEVLNAENPLLSREEVETIKRTDPETYRQEFLGEALVPENSLFGLFEEQNKSNLFEAVEL